MRKTNILIIDDNVVWHKLISRLLDDIDCDVRTAATCADGVMMAGEHEPDCVLLDFHMGDGNAVTVCSELRKNGKAADIPVIVMSSDPEAEFPAYAECHAAYFFLKGAHTMQTLRNVVAKALE